jgi:excisionase family DNA binding protein
METMTGQLLTAEQLADRWQVPKSHVYRLTREQRIPAVRLGKYYRYRLDQVEAFELGADTVPVPDSGRGNRVNGPPA